MLPYQTAIRSALITVAIALVLVCGFNAPGQSGRKSVAVDGKSVEGEVSGADEVVRVRTDEVVLPVSVRDQSGAPVSGLDENSFFVYDNGVRQEIRSFNRRRIPANIVLLLDASGSVFSRMRFIRAAAKGFVQGLLKEDSVCVMQFADRVDLLEDWTEATETAKLEKAIDWRYHAGESTAFYDGLYLAAEQQLSKLEGRRIVILLTDGVDTSVRKRATFNDALNAVRRAEATVYVVSLTASLRAEIAKKSGGRWAKIFPVDDPRQVAKLLTLVDNAESLLTGLAAQTGGRIFLPVRDEDLETAYRAIAEELRTQYIITYRPKQRPVGGEWRRIRVLVSPGIYEVATREGYLGRT